MSIKIKGEKNILYNVSVCHFWKHNILKSIEVGIHFSTVFNGDIQATQHTDQSGF